MSSSRKYLLPADKFKIFKAVNWNVLYRYIIMYEYKLILDYTNCILSSKTKIHFYMMSIIDYRFLSTSL